MFTIVGIQQLGKFSIVVGISCLVGLLIRGIILIRKNPFLYDYRTNVQFYFFKRSWQDTQ